MFTGLITDIGLIKNIEKPADIQIIIQSNYQNYTLGESICCHGACMTVVDFTNDAFVIDVSAESIDKTNIGAWKIGDKINLERSLKMGDDMGGHIVTGHVDGVADVIERKSHEGSTIFTIIPPAPLMKMIAPKGSVTLNGISLTVNDVMDTEFTVNIIPHTLQKTTMSDIRVGDQMNIEIDTIARYIQKQLQYIKT